MARVLGAVNAFCELVGCRLPLQQAGMSRVANPTLAAAVAEAGGLGMLALSRHSPQAATRDIDDLRAGHRVPSASPSSSSS